MMATNRTLTDSNRMPHVRIWRRALHQRYGAHSGSQMIDTACRIYRELIHNRERVHDRALQRHLDRQILPGLALYRALQEWDANNPLLLREMEDYLGMTFGLTLKLIPLLGLLPDTFRFFRRLLATRMADFPDAGWDTQWIENSHAAVAFNLQRCFYLDMLTLYGAAELTAAFCHSDELLASAFPPSIRFVRTGTLAKGDACCDFRYERGKR